MTCGGRKPQQMMIHFGPFWVEVSYLPPSLLPPLLPSFILSSLLNPSFSLFPSLKVCHISQLGYIRNNEPFYSQTLNWYTHFVHKLSLFLTWYFGQRMSVSKILTSVVQFSQFSFLPVFCLCGFCNQYWITVQKLRVCLILWDHRHLSPAFQSLMLKPLLVLSGCDELMPLVWIFTELPATVFAVCKCKQYHIKVIHQIFWLFLTRVFKYSFCCRFCLLLPCAGSCEKHMG